MPDTKTEKKPVKRDRAALPDCLEQVLGRLRTPAFAVIQLLKAAAVSILQQEDIGRLPDPAVFEKLFHLFGPKPLDVKGGTADEVLQLLHGLRRTNQAAGAPTDGIAVFADRLGIAFGTKMPKPIRCRIRRPF